MLGGVAKLSEVPGSLQPSGHPRRQRAAWSEHPPMRPAFQGVLSVMLLFTVLELGVAIPSSILWWKQARSSIPGVSPLGLGDLGLKWQYR